MKDVLAVLKNLFDTNHPLSDVVVGLLPIAIWELLRFLLSALMTPGGKRKELKGRWEGKGADVYVRDAGKATMALPCRWTSKSDGRISEGRPPWPLRTVR